MNELIERIKYYIEINKKKIIIISIVLVVILSSVLSIILYNKYNNKDNQDIFADLDEIIEYKDENKNEEEKEDKISEIDISKEEITNVKVDIKGEVKNPGVYELSSTSRIIDAINIAGGLTKNASTKVNNLSRFVKDEMVIIIYSKKEIENIKETKKEEQDLIKDTYYYKDVIKNDSNIYYKDIDSNTNNLTNNIVDNNSSLDINIDEIISSDSNISNDKISINEAGIDELTTLSGIGEAKAKAIIEYRTTNGSFKNIEDIMNVSGIGQAAFDKIKDYITI